MNLKMGYCDCCQKYGALRFSPADRNNVGIDTSACGKCRGLSAYDISQEMLEVMEVDEETEGEHA